MKSFEQLVEAAKLKAKKGTDVTGEAIRTAIDRVAGLRRLAQPKEKREK